MHQILPRLHLPVVVQVQSQFDGQLLARLVEVVLRVADEKSGNAATLLAQGALGIQISLVTPRQRLVVADFQGAFHPAAEPGAAILFHPVLKIPAGRFHRVHARVTVHRLAGKPAPQLQIAVEAVDHAEHVEPPGRRLIDNAVFLDQQFGGVQVVENVLLVVIEEVMKLGVPQDSLGIVLHFFNGGEHRFGQMLAGIAFQGRVVHDSIQVARLAQLVGGHTDILRAFLPGQIVVIRDFAQAHGMNGIEHAIPHGQQHVGRRQRNRSAAVTVAEHDAHRRERHAGHLGNQIGDAMGLVVAVGLLPRVGTRCIDERHHGHAVRRIKPHQSSRTIVVVRHPHAVLVLAVLRQHDHAPLPPAAEEVHLGQIQRPFVDLADDGATHLPDYLRRALALGMLGGGDGAADVIVHRRPAQPTDLLFDLLRGQHAGQPRFREVAGEVPGIHREVGGDALRFHEYQAPS